MLTLLACAAAFLLVASSVMAAALGPHQQPSATTNPCRTCHDTASGTPALKGWSGSGAGPATGWGSKPLSALCYMCHEALGGGFGGHDMSANAYAASSHQYTIANVPEEPTGAAQGTDFATIAASGLPYTAVAVTQIECTSCHNVHVSTNRPFNQRAGYQLMCDECHAGRVNNTSATSIAAATRSFSTHPTQQALNDTARANIKAVAALAANLKVATPAAPNYAIGGHLNDPGGATGVMDCQACHAVHGPTQNTPGVNDLLAIDNSTGAGGSALCEGCHFGGLAGEQVGSVAAYIQSALPAGSYSDHPIDNNLNRTFYPTGVALPANWTIANPNLDRGAQPFFASATPSGTPACSSCHDIHGGIDNTPLMRGPLPNGTFVPTVALYDEWCFACHTAAQVVPNNHHSNVNNMNVAVLADEFTSQLSCGDCHGASGVVDWTAHNGFWTWVVAISNTDSLVCQGCHVPNNPRVFVAGGLKGGQTYTAATMPATHGTLRDVVDTTGANNHQVNQGLDATNANLTTAPAWAFAGNEAGRVSQWAAGPQPICESCHNILYNGIGTNISATGQGQKQGWRGNILLAPYEDDNVGATGSESGPTAQSHDWWTNNAYVAGGSAGQTGVDFCRACHRGQGANPADFVHNPPAHTADSTTFAYGVAYGPLTAQQNPTPYGRGTTSVLTTGLPPGACPNATTADRASAPNGISYPVAAGQVNCDSCHRPHNADPDSLDGAGNRHLILEITDANWGTTICAECHDTDIQCQ